MKECEFCGQEKELLDGVVEGRPAEICRECVELHKVVILQKPSSEKMKAVERLFTVKERLEEASRVREFEKAKKLEELKKKAAFPETISYRLRKQREKAGMSKEKLADLLGISIPMIAKIEAGEDPSGKILKRYEQLFKKKFKDEQEEEEVSFRGEKITFREILDKAKTFFTGKKLEKPESEDVEVTI